MYRSPEMNAGEECDCQHDMYALGLVLVEMLLGKLNKDMDEDDCTFTNSGAISVAGIGGLIAKCKDNNDAMSTIVAGLLQRTPSQRLTPVKVIARLQYIEMALLGARVATTDEEVLARKQTWVDGFTGLAGILDDLKDANGDRVVKHDNGAGKVTEAKARKFAKRVAAAHKLTEDEAADLFPFLRKRFTPTLATVCAMK